MTVPQPRSRFGDGGSFLFQPVGRRHVFTPEQFTDEQRLIYETALEFTVKEVVPHYQELEGKSTGRMVELVRRAGALGLLANDIPEAYGGLGGDKVTSMLLAEAISQYAGWSVTVMAHNGIGTLPIVYFGTEEQKQRYLPKLATAEWIGAYALTEPGSGSDALAAKTRAVPTSDGSAYLLSGTKQFITNAAWADLFVVFAQVETDAGPRFTAFLVERALSGVSVGAEEKKIGLHGSSTRSLLLEEVRVPRENVLGEIGRGHKIAFNILNVGRWKLGAGAVGGMKNVMKDGVAYAKERKQFGRAIVQFGAIRKKLARSATSLFAVESMCYRVAGLLDERITAIDSTDPATYDRQVVEAIEEYAVEASLLKIAGSEALAEVVDEMVQVHGGYGYLEEYLAARYYRDNRINRIFEGTNEVNRLLVPGTIVKRSLAGTLPLMQAFAEARQLTTKVDRDASETEADEDLALVESCKRATVYAVGVTVGRYLNELPEQEEILEALADAILFCFGLDSAFSRALQAEGKRAEWQRLLAQAYAADVTPRLFERLTIVLAHAASDPTERKEHLLALHRLLSRAQSHAADYDVIALHERIATQVIESGGYHS